MTVGIISGAEGTGKTSQLLELAKTLGPSVWGILELKDEEKITSFKTADFRPDVLYEIYEDGTEFQGDDDPIKTLDAVRNWRDGIFNQRPLPATIVLDGISDLRDYAIDEWLINDNKKRAHTGREPREAIGEKNLGAWGAINLTVRKILKPIINKALKAHVNFFMTAQMKDRYLNGDIVGQTPDLKSFMSYPVPCLFIFSYDDGYVLDCTKEPENPRWSVKNIKKGTGLLDALRKHNLIATAPVDFMVEYEEEGNRDRAFVEAADEAEAAKKFRAKYPKAKVKEISK